MISKTDFFKNYGSKLVPVTYDAAEYGDHMLLAPEENEIAQQYHDDGYRIFTIYEESREGGDEWIEESFNKGGYPYVIGYFIVNK